MNGTENSEITGPSRSGGTRRTARDRGGWLKPLSTFRALGLVLLAVMSALSSGAAGALAADYAVYEEHSPETKPMQPGANLRALNRVITQMGDAIHLDTETGIVSLKAGTYRISGVSVLTYFDAQADTDGRVSAQARPNASYAMLLHPGSASRDVEPLALGTVSTANMDPSLLDAILTFDADTQIVLMHQAGRDVGGIYLQVYVDGSDKHVMARLVIQKLD
ncbi:hypothetical protein [Ancylobacter pratisalsi]|uniref:Uncharacterized protein n=1 Tax=Ancylobacter pratisalsi TaxID=1745854 RepID=A0A6P1YS06_9HYPH|nr:hypothetical protein [Ancylobacter pratisalsi]QIB35795.1 hypothetical protein G3A50_20335 [Ancylobacter pratisalsi]